MDNLEAPELGRMSVLLGPRLGQTVTLDDMMSQAWNSANFSICALALSACGDGKPGISGDATPACMAFPVVGESVDGHLVNDDTCLRWNMEEGENVVLRLTVEGTNTDCSGKILDAVVLGTDPIVEQNENDTSVWQYVILGTWAGEGSVDVTCDDGTRWEGVFDVNGSQDSGAGR